MNLFNLICPFMLLSGATFAWPVQQQSEVGAQDGHSDFVASHNDNSPQGPEVEFSAPSSLGDILADGGEDDSNRSKRTVLVGSLPLVGYARPYNPYGGYYGASYRPPRPYGGYYGGASYRPPYGGYYGSSYGNPYGGASYRPPYGGYYGSSYGSPYGGGWGSPSESWTIAR